MKSYFNELDGLLEGKNGEADKIEVDKSHRDPKTREEQYNHSLKQLSKLTELMKMQKGPQ